MLLTPPSPLPPPPHPPTHTYAGLPGFAAQKWWADLTSGVSLNLYTLYMDMVDAGGLSPANHGRLMHAAAAGARAPPGVGVTPAEYNFLITK
jgi:hypothetical protein